MISRALVKAVMRYTELQGREGPFFTAIEGLIVLRSNRHKLPTHMIHQPALCVVVQGAKSTAFGDKRFDYKAGQALVVSVAMPGCSRIIKATAAEPFLGIAMEFNPSIMRGVMEELKTPPGKSNSACNAFVADLDAALNDCALRAMRLLATPNAIPILYPAIMKEVCYHLLSGPNGGEIAKMTLGSDHDRDVIRTIHDLRQRFAEPITIKELAAMARLSPSAFHRKFKALTAMTPLQYQKQLRLLEARSLMISGTANVETAAYKVGYKSASQFSREYAHMFEMPPRRDIVSRGRVAA